MSSVAREAGVATGTAYTHYASKDELVLAAYRETKTALGLAITADLDPNDSADRRFHAMWLACYHHLKANPEHARFLLQVEHSPYRGPAHAFVLGDVDDPLVAQAALPVFAERLRRFPLDVLYELSFSPAVRLAAGDADLAPAQLDEIADACWRAVSRPG
jgi:AcrR family transcriptional regulator